MATVDYPHISLDSASVPTLTGTRIKVVEIVLDHLAHGSGAEEIQRQFPHFIEEDGAAVRQSEPAVAPRGGTGERTAFVAIEAGFGDEDFEGTLHMEWLGRYSPKVCRKTRQISPTVT